MGIAVSCRKSPFRLAKRRLPFSSKALLRDMGFPRGRAGSTSRDRADRSDRVRPCVCLHGETRHHHARLDQHNDALEELAFMWLRGCGIQRALGFPTFQLQQRRNRQAFSW